MIVLFYHFFILDRASDRDGIVEHCDLIKLSIKNTKSDNLALDGAHIFQIGRDGTQSSSSVRTSLSRMAIIAETEVWVFKYVVWS